MRILRLLFLSSLITTSSFAQDKESNDPGNDIKAKWIINTFKTLASNKYPRVKAISWWHENFDRSWLRVDSSPQSLEAYNNFVCDSIYQTVPKFESGKLVPPTKGIYHAAYPDFGGTEDIVTAERVADFEKLVDQKIAWAYFSNNWGKSIKFPNEAIKEILKAGRQPYIRLMPRSVFEEGGPDPIYTMQRIIDGKFDKELKEWAIEAAKTKIPLLAEFGTEINGNWFSWNGEFNGGGTTKEYGDPKLYDGPERFRDAYRHIIDICRANGANNITWFFHVDALSLPATKWNKIKYYYPGDDYIDWFGISAYGPQEPENKYREFEEIMDDIYPDVLKLSKEEKPIAILEFAMTEIKK